MASAHQLGDLRPLNALSGEELAQFLRGCVIHKVPAGVEVQTEGVMTESAVAILDGGGSVTARLGDRCTIIALKSAPFWCGLECATGMFPFFGLETTSPSRLLFAPMPALGILLGKNAKFTTAVLECVLEFQREVLSKLTSQKLCTSLERVAAYVLEISNGQRGVVNLQHEKRKLASLLGMSPENLSRSIVLLARHGLRRRGDHLEIIDPRALAEIAVSKSMAK